MADYLHNIQISFTSNSNQINNEFKNVNENLYIMQRRLRELLREGFAGKSPEEIAKLKREIGDLKNRIQDLRAEYNILAKDSIESMLTIARFGASIYSVFYSTSKMLVGKEGSKALEEYGAKLLMLISLLQSLQEVSARIRAGIFTEIGYRIKRISTIIWETSVLGANRIAMLLGAQANGIFARSLAVTGVGVFVVGIGLLISKLMDYTNVIREASNEGETYSRSIEKITKNIKELSESLDEMNKEAIRSQYVVVTQFETYSTVLGQLYKNVGQDITKLKKDESFLVLIKKINEEANRFNIKGIDIETIQSYEDLSRQLENIIEKIKALSKATKEIDVIREKLNSAKETLLDVANVINESVNKLYSSLIDFSNVFPVSIFESLVGDVNKEKVRVFVNELNSLLKFIDEYKKKSVELSEDERTIYVKQILTRYKNIEKIYREIENIGRSNTRLYNAYSNIISEVEVKLNRVKNDINLLNQGQKSYNTAIEATNKLKQQQINSLKKIIENEDIINETKEKSIKTTISAIEKQKEYNDELNKTYKLTSLQLELMRDVYEREGIFGLYGKYEQYRSLGYIPKGVSFANVISQLNTQFSDLASKVNSFAMMLGEYVKRSEFEDIYIKRGLETAKMQPIERLLYGFELYNKFFEKTMEYVKQHSENINKILPELDDMTKRFSEYITSRIEQYKNEIVDGGKDISEIIDSFGNIYISLNDVLMKEFSDFNEMYKSLGENNINRMREIARRVLDEERRRPQHMLSKYEEIFNVFRQSGLFTVEELEYLRKKAIETRSYYDAYENILKDIISGDITEYNRGLNLLYRVFNIIDYNRSLLEQTTEMIIEKLKSDTININTVIIYDITQKSREINAKYKELTDKFYAEFYNYWGALSIYLYSFFPMAYDFYGKIKMLSEETRLKMNSSIDAIISYISEMNNNLSKLTDKDLYDYVKMTGERIELEITNIMKMKENELLFIKLFDSTNKYMDEIGKYINEYGKIMMLYNDILRKFDLKLLDVDVFKQNVNDLSRAIIDINNKLTNLYGEVINEMKKTFGENGEKIIKYFNYLFGDIIKTSVNSIEDLISITYDDIDVSKITSEKLAELRQKLRTSAILSDIIRKNNALFIEVMENIEQYSNEFYNEFYNVSRVISGFYEDDSVKHDINEMYNIIREKMVVLKEKAVSAQEKEVVAFYEELLDNIAVRDLFSKMFKMMFDQLGFLSEDFINEHLKNIVNRREQFRKHLGVLNNIYNEYNSLYEDLINMEVASGDAIFKYNEIKERITEMEMLKLSLYEENLQLTIKETNLMLEENRRRMEFYKMKYEGYQVIGFTQLTVEQQRDLERIYVELDILEKENKMLNRKLEEAEKSLRYLREKNAEILEHNIKRSTTNYLDVIIGDFKERILILYREITNSINTISEIMYTKQKRDLEKYYEERLKYVKRGSDEEMMILEEKAEREKELQKKKAKFDLMVMIGTSIANISSAIIAAQKLLPPTSYIESARIAVLGATELAKIYAQIDYIQSLNKGGIVKGPNINKDVVPALLTPGEFVVNKFSVKRYLPVLEKINDGTYGGLDTKTLYELGDYIANKLGNTINDKKVYISLSELENKKETYNIIKVRKK